MGSGETEAGLIVSKMLDRRLNAVAAVFHPTNLRYRRAAANEPRLQTMLTNAGMNGEDIRIEEFSGD